MPFTVSHAAAVLPLRRTRLPWSALVIGSFGPDFEYFLRINNTSRAWHYYPDVLLLCLPFTIFAYYLFHGLIKAPVTELLPEGLQRRIGLEDAYPRSVGAFAFMFAAIGIGIASHLAWDAVTHAYSWPWRHWAVLRKLLYQSHFTGYVYGFELAQTMSTALGLMIVLLFFWIWYRSTPAINERRGFSALTRWTICAVFVMVALVAGEHTARLRMHPKDFDFPQLLVISSMSWFMWEVVGYSVIMKIRGRSTDRG
jgi:hypothetical protein